MKQHLSVASWSCLLQLLHFLYTLNQQSSSVRRWRTQLVSCSCCGNALLSPCPCGRRITASSCVTPMGQSCPPTKHRTHHIGTSLSAGVQFHCCHICAQLWHAHPAVVFLKTAHMSSATLTGTLLPLLFCCRSPAITQHSQLLHAVHANGSASCLTTPCCHPAFAPG